MGGLATKTDVFEAYSNLRETLVESRDAVSVHMDRAVRRTVLTLSALMVSAGAAVVLLAWSVS
jgi:hypothetical protein